MIDPKMIPDEVLEAMVRPVTYPSGASVKHINALRLAAALNAWPRMHIGAPWVIGIPNAPSIILPLPKEGE